ncbi:hypothetical protein Tco_0439114 [Tanacetum coccineum]
MSRVATLVEDVSWVVMSCIALFPESLGSAYSVLNHEGACLPFVMSTPAYVDSKTITQSDLEEAPSEAHESQPLGSRVPLMSKEFEAFEPSGTRTVSSHSPVSSDSTAPLSPDHPLTYVSPTPTPTQVSYHRRTARMTVRVQPAMSPGHSARVAEVMALSDSAFCKRYRSSYETPSSSSSPTLPIRKRYQGTYKLILDTDNEGDELGDEDTEEGDDQQQ